VPDALDELMKRMRADLDAHLTALGSGLAAHTQEREDTWRNDLEARVQAERAALDARLAEAQRDFETRLASERQEFETRFSDERHQRETQFAAERRELESRLADERLERQATLAALEAETREERSELFARLTRAVRRLDESASLTTILEALAKGVIAEASRVAVLIVEPMGLRCWAQFGFGAEQGPFDVVGSPAGTLRTVVASGQPATIASGDAEAVSHLPVFMRPEAGQAGLITPLAVGGETVAVLYAEGADRRSEQEDPGIWAEEVELLVRHAAARLENVTSERTVALLTQKS
jgi:hypothetical protein